MDQAHLEQNTVTAKAKIKCPTVGEHCRFVTYDGSASISVVVTALGEDRLGSFWNAVDTETGQQYQYLRPSQYLSEQDAIDAAAGMLRDSGAPAADWDEKVVRQFIVDNENGDDRNIGYQDVPPPGYAVTPALIPAIALKTQEELRKRLPRNGAGRTCRILIVPRSDDAAVQNKAGKPDYLDANYRDYTSISFEALSETTAVKAAGFVMDEDLFQEYLKQAK